jgi:hypothetical protein
MVKKFPRVDLFRKFHGRKVSHLKSAQIFPWKEVPMDDIELRRMWRDMHWELTQIRHLLEHLVDPTIMHYGGQPCAGCDVKIREEELRHVKDQASEEDWQEAESRER